MALVRSYWSWLGRRLWLSHPGRVLFTGALLVCASAIAIAHAHGAREGGAPLVVLVMVLTAVVALDVVGRGAIAAARRLTRR